jgi:hypothetical protein
LFYIDTRQSRKTQEKQSEEGKFLLPFPTFLATLRATPQVGCPAYIAAPHYFSGTERASGSVPLTTETVASSPVSATPRRLRSSSKHYALRPLRGYSRRAQPVSASAASKLCERWADRDSQAPTRAPATAIHLVSKARTRFVLSRPRLQSASLHSVSRFFFSTDIWAAGGFA